MWRPCYFDCFATSHANSNPTHPKEEAPTTLCYTELYNILLYYTVLLEISRLEISMKMATGRTASRSQAGSLHQSGISVQERSYIKKWTWNQASVLM